MGCTCCFHVYPKVIDVCIYSPNFKTGCPDMLKIFIFLYLLNFSGFTLAEDIVTKQNSNRDVFDYVVKSIGEQFAYDSYKKIMIADYWSSKCQTIFPKLSIELKEYMNEIKQRNHLLFDKGKTLAQNNQVKKEEIKSITIQMDKNNTFAKSEVN